MSEITSLITRMRAAGVDCDAIFEAIMAIEADRDERRDDKKAQDRIRKARQRAEDREALKINRLCHADRMDSTEAPDRKVSSSPEVSSSSPTPPITTSYPPSSSKPDVSREPAFALEAEKSKRSKAKPPGKYRLPVDWELPDEFMEIALAHRDLNYPDMQLTREEILNEGRKIRTWSNKPGPRRARTRDEWVCSWGDWISRGAPALFEQRLRAERARSPANRNGAPQSRFAPNVSMFDALAIAGAAGGAGPGEGREQPSPGTREPLRVVGAEILDPGDERGSEAGWAGGNRRPAGPSLFPLPAAAVG